MAVTAASAVAFAPLTVQGPRELPIGMTSPAVELAAAVDPQELIEQLQTAVNTVVNGVSGIAELPTQAFVTATATAQSGVSALYDALINAASDPQVKAVLTGLQHVQVTNLGYVLNTATDLAGITDYWLNDSADGLATNVAAALNDAIELTLNALAGVINDPLALQSWTSLLSSAVYSGLWGAGDLAWAAYAGISLPLDLLQAVYGDGVAPDYSGFAEWAGASVANWSNFAAGLLANLASQSGSPLVEGLTKALLSVTATPLSVLAQGFADASNWTPVYTAVIAPWNVAWAAANVAASAFYGAGNSIGGAIDAIGAGPLDPANYVTALQGFVTAGFNLGNDAIWSADQVAQSAPRIVNSLAFGGEAAVNAVVNAIAQSASGLLAAAGAAPDVVQAPIDLAGKITSAISNATTTVTDASDSVSTWLDDTSQQLVDANSAVRDQINSWLGGIVPGSAAASAAARTVTLAVDAADSGPAAGATTTPDSGAADTSPVATPAPKRRQSAVREHAAPTDTDGTTGAGSRAAARPHRSGDTAKSAAADNGKGNGSGKDNGSGKADAGAKRARAGAA
ncbi:hypothetical protein B1R94_24395 [Mycolicibacterium litorale]|nr:hypothetical protein B1R94_24395 [Mycolicibacterium litorale]